ncbi:phage tail protein [Ornithinimicrobium pekingense]|uniref:Uncharacterized protein n=1 Tax=Ornithinimicrobium pekingense TaxID=384677 RepID=A0ABQ2F980_9MICO|nr:phage tail protein [Ornithinimicrobium pekingense]GGK63493.1 hypothetical protein GCM10011509_09880 [Ornithinimicrobium pekingense]
MSAYRWLAREWAGAEHYGTAVEEGALALAEHDGGYGRHGVAVLRAGRPDPAQVDTTTADRWRRVVVRLAEPVTEPAWLRVWTVVVGAGPPPPPDPAADLPALGPAVTPADRWRAAPTGALDVRVLAAATGVGDLWVGLELGGAGGDTPRVADVLVETGDDGLVTLLPPAYRQTTAGDVDDGDGLLGRYLGLLGATQEQATSVLDELPTLLSPAVAPDREDAPWLGRLAAWVALDPARLPRGEDDRRETVSSAVERYARRGTALGLRDQVRRETGLTVDVVEPLARALIWRLGADLGTSALGLTTGLLPADPGPPVLDTTALLDRSMLTAPVDAGLPVHGALAHRICVHVPDGSAADVAAVDAVVQRERPAHVLARTCATTRTTRLPVEVGTDALPGTGPPGLPIDEAHDPRIDGPAIRLGTARLAPTDPSPAPGDPR